MSRTKEAWLALSSFVIGSCVLVSVARADDASRATLQAAIKAHGGKENLAKTLTGTVVAKVKMALTPDEEASVTWEETFELPRRHRRSIKGQFMGKDFSMEFAITDGSGWIRMNDGEVEDYKGYVAGKKVMEMKIIRIELLKKLDNRLFEKP
jgi:hypothetical protein